MQRLSDEVFWGYMRALRQREATAWLQQTGVPKDQAASAVLMCARSGFSDEHQLRLVVKALADSGLAQADRDVLELMRVELESDIAEERRRVRSYQTALAAYRTLPWWRRWRAPHPKY